MPMLIQVYHPNLHRTHITHTNGYILRSHALIQHTLVFAPLVVSIPAQYTVCQQYNSPDTSQQHRTMHTPNPIQIRPSYLTYVYYFTTYILYYVLLNLSCIHLIYSALWYTFVYSILLYIVDSRSLTSLFNYNTCLNTPLIVPLAPYFLPS